MPTISPNSLVVVTGITGYIASHAALLLLREGQRVRGTVRPASLERTESLKDAFIQNGLSRDIIQERLEFVGVEDDEFFSEETWKRVFKDANGVEHIAFPLDDFSPELVGKAVNNLTTMLRAAKQTSTIKRFVFTSSEWAVIIAPDYVDRPVTVEDYNEPAINVVVKGESIENYPALKRAENLLPYAASKAMAEKAAFDFMEKEQPSFEFVTVLPATTIGPVLYGKPSLTPAMVLSSLQNDSSWTKQIFPQWAVDVRDVAKLHYFGLTKEQAGGKRLFAVAEPWGPNDLFAILRKAYPGKTIPNDFEGGEKDKQKWDNSGSSAILGGNWINFEQSVLDTIKSLRDRGLIEA